MGAIKSFLKVILYKPLFNMLILLVWLIPGNNVGVAIILLTIIIRLLLLPSSAKSIKAQKQLKEFQPELDKIKEKYKDDNQAQSKALMDFYQANEINPLASCLPLLIQLPIIMILYYVFINGLNTSRYDELLYAFMPRPEINTMFLWVDLSKPNLYFAIVAGILQYFQTKQITGMQPKPAQNNKDDKSSAFQNALNNQLTYIMPVFTVIIAMKLPAALPVYWIVTTLFAIVQQYFIMKDNKKDPKGVSVKILNK